MRAIEWKMKRFAAVGAAAWLLAGSFTVAQSGLITRDEALAALYPGAVINVEWVFLTAVSDK